MGGTIRLDEGLVFQCELAEYAQGGSVGVAENGQGAKPKVKVLRLVMTPTAGCELLRRLRNDPLVRDVPIVVLTR